MRRWAIWARWLLGATIGRCWYGDDRVHPNPDVVAYNSRGKQ